MTKPGRKPPLLPEQNIRATQPAPRVRRRRTERLLWLALLITVIALGFVSVVIVYEPGMVGLQRAGDATGTGEAFSATGAALADTAVALNDRDFALESTSAALDVQSILIDQRQTQVAQGFVATETAIAVVNAQQATRAALDFQGTQIAFQQEATRVELNYRGTQAALNRDATAIALGFATQAPPAPDAPPETLTPTQDLSPLFEDGFTTGVSSGLWRLGDPLDWGINPDGTITARRSGAWLLTQINTLTDYTLEIDLIPIPDVAADYFVIVNFPPEHQGLAVRLTYNGSRLTAAGLYRFDGLQLLVTGGLIGQMLPPVSAVQLPDMPQQAQLSLTVDVRGTAFTVRSGGVALLAFELDAPLPPGAIGLQLPDDARVARVAVLP